MVNIFPRGIATQFFVVVLTLLVPHKFARRFFQLL